MSSQDDQRVALQRAFELIQSGQKLQASKIISQVLKANPNNADGWYMAALATENIEKKARLLERALDINPHYIEARRLLEELDEGSQVIDNLLRETEPLITTTPPPPSVYKPPAPKPAASTSLMNGNTFWGVVGVLVGLIILGGLWAIGQARGELFGIVFRASETPTITPTPTIKPTLPPTWTLTPAVSPTPTATATYTATATDVFSVTATAYAQFNQFVQTAVVQTQAASSFSNPPVSNAPLQQVPTWTPPYVPPSFTPTVTPENLINSTVTRLNFRVIAAEYSASLKRIIVVSDSPNQLHIYDPVKNTDVTVDLPRVPTSVGVQPDGLFAAVGHDALISYVDLKTAKLVYTLEINQRVGHVALAGNGWVYTVPDGGQWVPMGAVKISTGKQIEGPRVWGENILRIYQNGQKIYGANRGTSPDDIFRINLNPDTGFADVESGYPLDSPYHGDYYMCGDLWLSQDGQRIFTACGAVFRSSDAPDQDMTYNGSVNDLPAMGYMFHSQAAGIVLGLSLESGRGINLGGPFLENKMAIWDYQNLTLRKMVILPDFSITGSPYPSHGRYVFVNTEGTEYYVIVQVDSAAAQINDYGLIVGKVSDISP